MVVDASYVPQRRGKSRNHRNGNILEQVLRITVEVFHRTAQTLAEEAEVDTHIRVVARLPRQLVIGDGSDCTARVTHVLTGIAHQAHIAVIVRRQRTVNTIRGTYTQVAQERIFAHKTLAHDVPRSRH